MKRFKNYAFLGLVLGLVLAFTPTQSFASRYLTVGHRSDPAVNAPDEPTAESANITESNSSTSSASSESGSYVDDLTGFVALFLS